MSFLEKASTLLPSNVRNGSMSTNFRSLINTTLLGRLCQITLIGVCAILLILGLTGNISKPPRLHLPASFAGKDVSSAVDTGPAWPTDGWDGITNIFAFGDSYSDTAFDPSKTQPNADNPFGNPDWVLDLAAGTVWLHFLGLNDNSSTQLDPSSPESTQNGQSKEDTGLRIYNFAIGGSTIDPNVVRSFRGNPRASFTSQLHDTFLPQYASPPVPTLWTPQTTLFITWFGINDLVTPSYKLEYPPIPQLLRAYAAHWATLYTAGARNFLVLDIPPIYKAHNTASYATFEAAAVLNFNMQLNETVAHFKRRYPGVTMFYFSTHRLWDEALEAPGEFEATEQLARLEGPCEAYVMQKKDLVPDFYDERCDVAVEQYFWLNALHATYPVHNLTAEMVVRDCWDDVVPAGYCS